MSIDFVAEVSSNHNCNLERCLLFIDEAAQIGCNSVKFQLFKIEKLFAKEARQKHHYLEERKKWELPLSYIPLIANRCKMNNLLFSCTPFYLEAVQELLPYVDFYKIASYELLWHDLLKACAETKKPVVLSTGMANLQEIKEAVFVLQKNGCSDITLLHCVSGYPTALCDCNLAAIETLKKEFNCKVGWSDHSTEEIVIERAIHRFGAEMIEFHLDIDGKGFEYEIGHCWRPEKIKKIIEDIKKINLIDGNGIKQPALSEEKERSWRADGQDGLRPLKETRQKL